MPEVFGFNSYDAESIIQALDDGGIHSHQNRSRSPLNYIAKTKGGGIPARSGAAVSRALCNVCIIDGTTLEEKYVEVYVYNLSTTAIAGNTYIVAVRAGGVLVAVWEDCVDAE